MATDEHFSTLIKHLDLEVNFLFHTMLPGEITLDMENVAKPSVIFSHIQDAWCLIMSVFECNIM